MRSDEELMLAYREGDMAAFRELFARYAPLLSRVLKRFALREDRLADLIQHTFLQLHRARNDFDPQGELRPWLMTIAFNLAREQLRKVKRRPESELDLAAENRSARPPIEQQHADLRRDFPIPDLALLPPLALPAMPPAVVGPGSPWSSLSLSVQAVRQRNPIRPVSASPCVRIITLQ